MFKFIKRHMDYKFRARKLGNHWYLDIQHDSPLEIILCEKAERCFNLMTDSDEIYIYLNEVYTVVEQNTIFFKDDDIRRYLTTNDDFDLEFWIGDHQFYISSDLYYLLEGLFNCNFHKTLYTIELCSI